MLIDFKEHTDSTCRPFIYILLLNWNGWEDTIECLESVYRLNYNSFRVIVCDNNSLDGSLEYIKAWAEGQLDVFVPGSNKLRQLFYPPVPKTIRYTEYGREEAETGGFSDDVGCSLVLIQTGDNLGFAGGNNVGLRYALARDDFEYVWLLNNDTVVEPDSLDNLLNKAKDYKTAGERVGLIGSKLMFYKKPDTIQAVGGIYNKWFATSKHLGAYEYDNGQYDSEEITSKIDYPVGASILVAKEFIHDVGLLCEDYFLYYEEIDWSLRAKGEFVISFASTSIVYHKEGASIGTNTLLNERSDLADYYNVRNRILITNKYFKNYIVIVYLGIIGTAFIRLRRRQWSKVKNIIKLLY